MMKNMVTQGTLPAELFAASVAVDIITETLMMSPRRGRGWSADPGEGRGGSAPVMIVVGWLDSWQHRDSQSGDDLKTVALRTQELAKRLQW